MSDDIEIKPAAIEQAHVHRCTECRGRIMCTILACSSEGAPTSEALMQKSPFVCDRCQKDPIVQQRANARKVAGIGGLR